jgi:hypothetical protein
MHKKIAVLCALLACFALCGIRVPFAIAGAPDDPSKQLPVIDGGAGPCSLELTVNGPDGKPVYAAKVKVHITYGFGGFHKLDLEAGTNVDGKLKFTGLPDRVHWPPLEFHATKDDMEGTATYDPMGECQGKHDLTLAKNTPHAQ